MAHLRLMVIALAACGVADAQPSGITPPPGWSVLPGIANAAKIAAGAPGITVDNTEAWGDPAMGCYAVWMALHGSGGDAAAIAEQIRIGFAELKVALTDVVAPSPGQGADDGMFSATFERAPFKGRLRARVGGGKVTALACFGNQREPVACDTACAGVLGGLR